MLGREGESLQVLGSLFPFLLLDSSEGDTGWVDASDFFASVSLELIARWTEGLLMWWICNMCPGRMLM